MSREVEDIELESNWKFDPCSRHWSWMGKPFGQSINCMPNNPLPSNPLPSNPLPSNPLPSGKPQSSEPQSSEPQSSEPQSSEPQSGAALVRLPAAIGSSLNWQAQLANLPSGLILWHLDLAILPMSTPATEEGTFRALKFAVEQFTQKVWKPHKERSLGVILGHADLELDGFYWDLEQIEQFAGWLDDRSDATIASQVTDFLDRGDIEGFRTWSCARPITGQYVIQILSQYWHYLASSLSEDCPALVSFENQHYSLTEQILLLGQPIWEHLRLIGQGIHPSLIALERHRSDAADCIEPIAAAAPTHLGLVVPPSDKLTFKCAQEMAALMERLDEAEVSYRLIFESELTLHWSGLEDLLVFAPFVSTSGLRMLRGFQASMGNIFPIGSAPWIDSIQLPDTPRAWSHLLLS